AHLAGDASSRSYQRLTRGEQQAVLMDSPPGGADSPASFVLIADHLLAMGLSAPRILAKDPEAGFLLLEDLGDGLYARLIAGDPALELPLYAAATDALLHLQRHSPPKDLPDLSARDWAEAAAIAPEWYAFAVTGARHGCSDFVNALTDVLRAHADGPRVLILRDFHAENLLWLPGRNGLARVGLLDFQLAQLGQPEYDLVSLLQDARRDVGAETSATTIRQFAAQSGRESHFIAAGFAALGAQRALRILGVFARLCLVDGKSAYVDKLPRVWRDLQTNLRHPALAPLAAICARTLPEPTPAALRLIKEKCKTHPSP
ncbi:MAG: phosphotransferase, partial [Tabrizicola sp.]|nr:phosphotransferase [Tabrizicola sp.]